MQQLEHRRVHGLRKLGMTVAMLTPGQNGPGALDHAAGLLSIRAAW